MPITRSHACGMKAIFLAFVLLMQCVFVDAQNAPAPKPDAPKPKAGAVPPPAAVDTTDIGWPRQVTKDSGTLIYYQPQVDEWKDYKVLNLRVAFSLTPKGGKQALGVASIQAGTVVNKETRTVVFHDVQVNDVRFPSVDDADEAPLQTLFRELIPKGPQPISVDRLLAELDKDKLQAEAVPLKNDPPEIFYSASPAILLMVQGEPVLAPIEKTDLQFVVNTNWDLFFEKSKKHYYLLATSAWLTAPDLKGPWTQTQTLPKDMAKLPSGQNFDNVKKAIPPPPPSGAVPKVFYATGPAELVLTKGQPVYAKVAGTQLLYATNTENDFFVDEAQQQYYVLLSGRWFRSKGLNGPWSFAGGDLPADFSKIPEGSPKGHVLASVPGTVEASDAVMLAQIPTTAIVNRKEAEAQVKVTYVGDPEFKPIESTNLEYATNTQEKVIKLGDLYYLCFQAVWFVSSTPTGPWKTADSIPKEIYEIPPSSPVYNVTYVTQTSMNDESVESSSTAGYLGMFVVGTAVGLSIAYGTGYYYPPYWYWGPMYPYPIYYPWPYTYGAGVVYNPWTGGFYAGRAVYGPYGAAGGAAWYNPATGRYGRSASVQGWYGGRTVASAYNPWTGGYGATSQGHNAYAQWGRSAAVRGDDWVRTGHVTTDRGTIAGYQTSSGQQGIIRSGDNGTIARTSNGVYAGKDGNVYRKDSSGSWSKYEDGNWNTVDTSQARQQAQENLQNRQGNAQAGQNRTAGQSLGGAQGGSTQGFGGAQQGGTRGNVSPGTLEGLDRSAASRQRGQAQTQQFRNFQSRGGGFRRRR